MDLLELVYKISKHEIVACHRNVDRFIQGCEAGYEIVRAPGSPGRSDLTGPEDPQRAFCDLAGKLGSMLHGVFQAHWARG